MSVPVSSLISESNFHIFAKMIGEKWRLCVASLCVPLIIGESEHPFACPRGICTCVNSLFLFLNFSLLLTGLLLLCFRNASYRV